METTEEKIAKLKKILYENSNIVFFGGAGVSTESGVPDFRSKDGLYNNRGVRFESYSPEYLLSRDCLENEPEVFFEFYRQKLDGRSVKPNKAHYALAKLEREGRLKGVVTQNIDGLHQLAGSKKVFEIHGTTKRNYCMRCAKVYPADFIFECEEKIPRCTCGGVVRCDVTLYGEQLPEDAVRGAVEAISAADVLIIGGTSLTVYPAASYIDYFTGRQLVVINKQPLSKFFSGAVTLEINAPIGEVLGAATEG
ncbi:MAG: NAD-dependent protein deacylase [Clostridia bacterium]|nr:NAD-dependent protein deacylase [Clostridia bacterium]